MNKDINMKPIGQKYHHSPATSDQNAQLFGLAEMQHIHYLNSIYNNQDVGLAISNRQDAYIQLRQTYTTDYINQKTQLDLDDEITSFNLFSAFKTSHFIDWFAIRDYKEDGYVQINNLLRNNTIPSADDHSITQLTISLMHLSMMENINTPCYCNQILYRSEVRTLSKMVDFSEGDIFISPAFLSTSADKDTAYLFCGDQYLLEHDQVNVISEIKRTSVFAGPNITDLLQDGEDEVIFLPNTYFLITDVEHRLEQRFIYIKMESCDINTAEWNNRLLSLVTGKCQP